MPSRVRRRRCEPGVLKPAAPSAPRVAVDSLSNAVISGTMRDGNAVTATAAAVAAVAAADALAAAAAAAAAAVAAPAPTAATPSRLTVRTVRGGMVAALYQGLTLIHSSAQRKHIVWDTLGARFPRSLFILWHTLGA